MNGKTSVHTQRESNMSIPGLRRSVGVCVLTALAVAVPRVQAGIFDASQDTTIFENETDHSYGGGVMIYAGMNNSTSKRRGLIAFDLSSIPTDSIINSVELDLWLAQVSGGEDPAIPTRTIGVHKLLRDWGEGTIKSGAGQGDDANAGDATWMHRFHDTAYTWRSLGGDGDYAVAPSASMSVGTTFDTKYTWSSTTMIADVQGWVNDPTSNFGWLLKGDESTKGTFRTFWSREADQLDGAYKPKLVIYYTAVPEPMSFVLFAGGAVALLVMRRARRRSGIPGGRSESDLRWH
jgi:hypothetical protein